MAEPPPPSYDAVIAGTWQQDNTVPQNTNPLLPTAPPPLQYIPDQPPTSLTDVRFSSLHNLHSSQQSLNDPLTSEAPPSYNASVSQNRLNVPDNTQDDVVLNATSNNDDDDEEDACSSKFYL